MLEDVPVLVARPASHEATERPACGDDSDARPAVHGGTRAASADPRPTERDWWADGGTYTLLVDVPESLTVTVGALGLQDLPPGGYAYTGSALGTGGFSRVERHARLAAGESDARHWHVDYLLGDDRASLRSVVVAPGADAECGVAAALGDGPVAGFGASDCPCRSHLSSRQSAAELKSTVLAVYRRVASEKPL